MTFVSFQGFSGSSAANLCSRRQRGPSVIERMAGRSDDVDCNTISVIDSQQSTDLFWYLKTGFTFVNGSYERDAYDLRRHGAAILRRV